MTYDKKRRDYMTGTLPCKNIKKDLEYLNGIIEKQHRSEPTPDVARFRTQVEYKETLCRIMKEEKAM
jgi:hypothetical protein